MTGTALALKQYSDLVAAPIGSLDAYMARVSSLPMLSREQEIEFAERLRRDDDLEAARALVLSHLRFVVHVARGYMGYGLPIGDLIQEGNVGLMKAVKRFDPSLGVRLVSFAIHWIRAEIHEYVLRNWRLVRVATTKAQRKLFFNLRRMKKNLAWLSEDETQAVARDLGVAARDVREMEQRLSSRDLSFDPTTADSEEDVPFAPAAYLVAEGADPAADVEAAQWQQATSESLAGALGQLDERSRRIIEARWLGDDKLTLHQLAAEFGVSAERIRQIEAQTIARLRGLMA
jgi:RNA polymerase sigma-32 factor